MMRLTVMTTLLICAFSLQLRADKLLVEYEWGNQITKSVLSINEDGLIKRQVKHRGGMPLQDLPTLRLTEETQKKLEDFIEAVANSESMRTTGNITAFGSTSGKLVVYLQGKKIPVWIVERNQPGKKDIITYSNAKPAVKWIKAFVHSLVEYKMY